MEKRHRRWLKVTAATVGAGALAFGGVALPAAAEESSNDIEPTYINSESDKYERAAANSNAVSNGAELEQLEAAGAVVVTDDASILHVDPALSGPVPQSPGETSNNHFGGEIPGSPEEGSRPGAPLTIYIDFSGITFEDSAWNVLEGEESITLAPADSVSTDDYEAIWAAVAEDYAPFNVNVTLSDPGADALYKESADDNEYGVHVIVTDSYSDEISEAAGTSGLAFENGVGSEFRSGALVFTEGLGGDLADPKSIADTASHEAGHNFGLAHHGHSGQDEPEYYMPEGGLWGPIMGATFFVPVTQWSNGDYAGATSGTDDLATITDRSAAGHLLVGLTTQDGTPYDGPVCGRDGADPLNPQPGDVFFIPNEDNLCDPAGEDLIANWSYYDFADYAADDHGDDAGSATPAEHAEDGTFENTGVIETNTDVDVFSITTAGGPITAAVEVADIQPNLNAAVSILDADGELVASDEGDPAVVSETEASGLGADVSADVDAGTYYIEVEGVGFGDSSNATPEDANGFSDYASLGNYTLTGEAEPFDAAVVEITSPENGAEVTADEDLEVTGTGEPGATITLTVNGEEVGTTEVDEEGNWAVTVQPEYGDSEIVASQDVDGIDTGSDSVTVTAPVDAPVINSPEDGSTTEDTTPTVSGTGIPGATVTVTVTGTSGSQESVETEVDADGNWEVDLPELAEDVYVITASQEINGVASDVSDAVTLTVAIDDDGGNGGGGDDGNGDETLPETGSGFNMGFAMIALTLLMIGGGMAAVGYRQRQLTIES